MDYREDAVEDSRSLLLRTHGNRYRDGNGDGDNDQAAQLVERQTELDSMTEVRSSVKMTQQVGDSNLRFQTRGTGMRTMATPTMTIMMLVTTMVMIIMPMLMLVLV